MFKFAAIAVFAAILGFSTRTSMATPVVNGSTLGGWTITYNTPGIGLAFDQADNTIVVLEKAANFTTNTGLLITFVQNGFSGIAPKIQFINESITNSSGSSWSGFEFQLLAASGSPVFEGPTGTFVPPTAGPGVNYTSENFSTTDIKYGGVQPSGTTSFWGTFGGGPNNGSLTIDTNPGASVPTVFTFKEIPIVVPLPAAAWQSLSGLLGLGLIGYARKMKKVLA